MDDRIKPAVGDTVRIGSGRYADATGVVTATVNGGGPAYYVVQLHTTTYVRGAGWTPTLSDTSGQFHGSQLTVI